MKLAHKVAAALAITGLAFGMAACSGPASETDADGSTGVSSYGNTMRLFPASVKLDDGREVLCVVGIGPKRGGLSCDWGGAK